MISSQRFNRIFALGVLALSILCLLGALYFFSESVHERVYLLFGLGLVIGSIAMMWGALKTLKEADTKEQIEGQVVQNISGEGQLTPNDVIRLDDEDALVIADWKFSKKEWKRRTAHLLKRNSAMEVVVSIGIIIVSGLTIFMGMEPGILIAGVFVAILFYVIRTKVVAKSYRLTGDEARILITDQFVKMNKRFVHYKNGTHFLKDIEVYKEPVNYILLVIAWPTGRGFDNSIDLRLPVPDDEIDNLPMVLEQLELAKKKTESNSCNIV